MEIFPLLSFFSIGVLAGLMGGLLGLSGGVIAVPSLIFVLNCFGFPQTYLVHTAIGTSLASMVLTGVVATWAHHRRLAVIWPIVKHMMPGMVTGSFLGAFIANLLSGVVLQLFFGIFITALGIYLLIKKKKKEHVTIPPRLRAYGWFGLAIGSLASLLGIGGGIFTVPMLIAHHHSEKTAIATSSAVSLCITFFSSLAYLYWGKGDVQGKEVWGYLYLPAFFFLALGSVLCAPLGVRLAHRIEGKNLRKLFGATLVLVGLLMVFR